jgi:hypothetical protein
LLHLDQARGWARRHAQRVIEGAFQRGSFQVSTQRRNISR